MKLTSSKHRLLSGFSLPETILVVAVIGIIAAVCVPSIKDIYESSGATKLESDLAVMNSAVGSYLLFGGNFEGTESLELVLAKLKSRASDETADQVVGLRGAFLDPRYQPVMQTSEESATDSTRVYWDSSKNKFVEATSGPPGIKKFEINKNYVNPELALTESRETSMDYAHNSTWIWDYNDAAAPQHLQVTPISVAMVPPPGPVGAVGTPLPPTSLPTPPVLPPPSPATILMPPTYSVAPGTYPITDFDLNVFILDPNPAGSLIKYSIDSGAWQTYTGNALTIGPGKILNAQAFPSSSQYLFSSVTGGIYNASKVSLLPPQISLSAVAFNLPSVNNIVMQLTNPNKSDVSRLDYRLNGGPWQIYSSSIQLKATDFPLGVAIETYAVSTSPYWNDSSFASTTVIAPIPNVSFTSGVSTAP